MENSRRIKKLKLVTVVNQWDNVKFSQAQRTCLINYFDLKKLNKKLSLLLKTTKNNFYLEINKLSVTLRK